MNGYDRRHFLKSTLLGTSGAFFSLPALAQGEAQTNSPLSSEKRFITRKLGKTGIELPIVSFGVMRADNPALVKAALEAGIVLFDTAHGYQRGKNEEMLGEVLKDRPRDSFVLATKVPPEEVDNRTGEVKAGSTAKAFLDKFDISLKRLKLDYVDILYVHGISSRDGALFPAMLEAVQTAKKSGKARHIGMSTHKNEPEVIQAAIESRVYEIVLSAINFKQDYYPKLKEAIANAAKAGIGIVAMKTMAGGSHDKERKQPINCKAALKFVLQDENVTTAIPGNTNFDHLNMNISVNTDLKMTDEEKGDLLLGKSQGGLYCQGCEQCVPNCLKGLPIPDIMRAYMYTYGYREPEMAHSLLSSLNLPEHPCSDCSHCGAACAKGFDISDRIKDVSRLTKVPVEFLS
ncbi:MAG: aldo/keto reductase [Ignavibacteriales bacterium]|nr:aldo/keto reductase [Ignavibacteriales bacterium]